MVSKVAAKKGFTLIELLIVIAIIGILSVALLPAITSGPARARDAARVAAVNDVVSAMEQYNLDEGGYPTQTGTAVANCLNFDLPGLGVTPPSGGDANVRSFFGKIPTVDQAGSALCGTPHFLYYKSFAGGANGNYMVAVQVERQDAANYNGALDVGNGNPVRTLADRTAVISATSGSVNDIDGPWVYIIAR